MSLRFSHGTAQWSYGGFGSFRRQLAKEIDVTLEGMKGFGGPLSWDTVNDPIVPLLNHSDCDGELTPDECRAVAPRLRELVADWPDDWDKPHALLLAAGMEAAAAAGEPLEFK